jgi:hypothetical protein
MAVNFPNSPTNGQTVTVDGVTYSWNAAGSVWDIVTTATATVAVTAPVVNTGTSTAAVLGIKTSPAFTGDGTNNIVEFKKSNGVTRTWVNNNGSDLYVGGNTTESGSVQIGFGATGNQYAYVDMIGDTTYTDFGARLIRDNGGPNTNTALIHRGTGALIISALDAGGIQFRTADAIRMKIEPNGDSLMSGNLIGKTGTGGTVANQNGSGSFEARGDGSNAASMSFHRPGNYAINMGLDTDNNFKIGGWSQGGTPYFQMNPSGHMRLPYQPYFYIKGTETNWVSTSTGDAPFNVAIHNRGSVFNTSNFRFTAPVTGVYNITFSFFANGGTATRLAIKVNGAAYNNSQNTYSPTGFTTWSGNMYLNANDYVTVGDWQGYTNAAVYMGHSHFSGYLLG